MRKLKRKKNYTSYIVVASIFVFSIMGVGYAYLQETLTMDVHMSKKIVLDFATDLWEKLQSMSKMVKVLYIT